MTPSEPGRDQPSRSPRWVRWLGFTPATQWSTRRRVVYGLFMVVLMPAVYYVAASGSHARGPWFGALAVLVYTGMIGWVVLTPYVLKSAGSTGPRSAFAADHSRASRSDKLIPGRVFTLSVCCTLTTVVLLSSLAPVPTWSRNRT